jgi:hypothetical protein
MGPSQSDGSLLAPMDGALDTLASQEPNL